MVYSILPYEQVSYKKIKQDFLSSPNKLIFPVKMNGCLPIFIILSHPKPEKEQLVWKNET